MFFRCLMLVAALPLYNLLTELQIGHLSILTVFNSFTQNTDVQRLKADPKNLKFSRVLIRVASNTDRL